MMQEWFRKAKLGIFIHYGIYAVGDVSESWSFHNGNISYEDYMKQCEGFTASKYDPAAWAELFKKAGAQYVVMTAKHHDGVALFDTQYSDLSVVKKTPAGRDLIREYMDAMSEAGLKTGIYFSLIDWSDPRYRSIYPEGMKREDCLKDIYGSPAGGEEDYEAWEEFLQFNRHQLAELMTGYKTVDLLWFDGDWERSAAQWKMPEFREYLHSLNPNVVLNSRMQGYGTPGDTGPAIMTIKRAGRSYECSATVSRWEAGSCWMWGQKRTVRWMSARKKCCMIWEAGFMIMKKRYTERERA